MKFSHNWNQFSQLYNYDQKVGYLATVQQYEKMTKFQSLNNLTQKLPELKSSQEIRKQIKNLKPIDLKQIKTVRNLLLIRDQLTYILGRYVYHCKKEGKQKNIFIPAPLSTLLVQSSDKLGLKYGVTASFSFLLTYIDDQNKQNQQSANNTHSQPRQPTMQNFKLRYCFSQHTKDQKYFFGTSVLTSFHLASVIRLCYQINQIIECDQIGEEQKNQEIQEKLIQMKKIWKKIYNLMIQVPGNLNPKIFYQQIRMHIGGFQNAVFQNCPGTYTSHGGSTGQDPNYQMFQRAMGIKIPQEYVNTQIKLQKGMIKDYRQMTIYFQQNSKIREYCQKNTSILEAYNDVISAYSWFNKFHNVYIKKYVLDFLTQEQQKEIQGTGGNNIQKLMKRSQVIQFNNILSKENKQTELKTKKEQIFKTQIIGQNPESQKLDKKTNQQSQQQVSPVDLSNKNTTSQQITKQQCKPISAYSANGICMQDPHNQNNPNGYIDFGISINVPNMSNIIKYLPNYIKVDNCKYTMAPHQKKLNQILSKGTGYNANQTIAMNNLVTIISMHAQAWKTISVQGNYRQIQTVKYYSHCQIVPIQQSNCHIVFFPTKTTIQYYLSKLNQKRTLLVVSDISQILYTDRTDIFYAVQRHFQPEITCGVCYYKDQQINNYFQFHFLNLQLSTFVSSTIQQTKNGLSKQHQQQLNSIHLNQNYKQNYMTLLNKSTKEPVEQQNVYFTIGSGCGLTNLGCFLFQKDDKVLLDKPFYFGLLPDFQKCGIKFQHQSLFQSTLKQKAQKALSNGLKGYIVVNPHNPTGKVFDPQQITQLCQWATNHPQFHVILDQMYHNSTHREQIKILSGISYVNNYKNIHVLRGFAKDFSLCGFKIGMLISSNDTVRQKYKLCEKIIRPQTIVLKTVSRMLKETNHGQVIFKQVKKILNKSTQIAMNLLQNYEIKHIKPKGGCFIILDLRDLLKKTNLTQQQLWMRLFSQYKVNVGRGIQFGFDEQGYFRCCHIINEKSLEEGIHRIGKAYRELTSHNSC